jgi:hypothetical protein
MIGRDRATAGCSCASGVLSCHRTTHDRTIVALSLHDATNCLVSGGCQVIHRAIDQVQTVTKNLLYVHSRLNLTRFCCVSGIETYLDVAPEKDIRSWPKQR